jgi:hypothetical protein
MNERGVARPARRGARLTYANLVSSLALFAALGARAYAATQLPANSVGTRQLKSDAATPSKVAPSTIRLFKGQTGDRGPQGSAGPQGTQGPKGDPGALGQSETNATVNGVAAGGGLAGSYPNPSIAAGALGPAQLGTIPAVRVTNSTDEPIANGDSPVTLSFDRTLYDNASMHSTSTNPSRLTAPIAGVNEIAGEVR